MKMHEFFVILLLIGQVGSVSYQFSCSNISDAISAFSQDPMSPDDPYVKVYSQLDRHSVFYPNSQCYGEILPAVYEAAKNLSVHIRKYRSEINQCCLDSSDLRSSVSDLSVQMFHLNNSLRGQERFDRVEVNKIRNDIEKIEKDLRKNENNIKHVISRISDHDNISISLSRIVNVLIDNGLDHEKRISMLERVMDNYSYHQQVYYQGDQNDKKKEDNNDGIFLTDDDDDEETEEKEEFTCSMKMIHTKFVFLFIDFSGLSQESCDQYEKLVNSAVIATSFIFIISLIVVSIMFSFLKHIVYKPLRKKLFIDSQIHSLMKRVRKNGRPAFLERKIGSLHLYEIKNVQYSVPMGALINKIAQGDDVYYVGAVMSVELRAREGLTIFERIFRSVRYREDTMLYLVIFGTFDSYKELGNLLPPLSKVNVLRVVGETPSFVLAGGWIVPSHGRIQNFLSDISYYLTRMTNGGKFGDRALLNIKTGLVPHDFIQAFANNDQLEFFCEGIVIFKNSILEKVIVMADHEEAASLQEAPNMDISQLPTERGKRRRPIRLTAASAPVEDDYV